jgi:CheY-like chemotaxis protein
VILEAIEDLRPIGGMSAETAIWRRYRHLILRYVEGLSLEQISHTLGVGVRQSSRDQHQAIDELIDVLWARLRSNPRPALAEAQGRHFADGEEAVLAAPAEGRASLAAEVKPFADLAETVDRALETLGSLAAEKGVTFKSLVADALPPVAISPMLLRQAILNLLVFAADVAQGCQVLLVGTDTVGGVNLRAVVQATNKDVRRTARLQQPGPEAQELLAAAAVLLSAQCGVVELGAVAIGQAIFTMTMPPVALRTLLAVDDNPDFVGLLRRYLRHQPYRVIQATSGEAALDLSLQARPEAILLDVMLPSQDGWDTLRQLRRHSETRDIPVIVCSVLPERALARSLGVTGFLPKPFTRQDLVEMLQRCYPAGSGPQAR